MRVRPVDKVKPQTYLEGNGVWKTVCLKKECHQRLVYVPLDAVTDGIRLVPLANWGAEDCHLFALEAE